MTGNNFLSILEKDVDVFKNCKGGFKYHQNSSPLNYHAHKAWVYDLCRDFRSG